jgi:uncharacterized tellurite resistance protein B-like protein
MNIFSVDLTPSELNCIRQSLDLMTVKGTDAKFLANLQVKIENEIMEISNILQQEQTIKEEALKHLIASEEKKSSKK